MVSPVAQMILDLIENQLDEADISAIDFACTNKLLAQRHAEKLASTANAAPNIAWKAPYVDIWGSQDAQMQPVVSGQKYRINQNISPKYLRGITGIAKGRATRTRKRNMIEVEVDAIWRPRCKRFLDTTGQYINVPGIVLQKVSV